MRALQRAGFARRGSPAGCTELQREGETIEVPMSERLQPEVLVAILQRAGIGPSRLLMLLDEPWDTGA